MSGFTTFSKVELGPPDAIFLVKQKFLADTSDERMDLGIGAYRDANGKPYVLNIVKKVEKALVADETATKEYLGIKGDP
jgi:aspartate/tyrosine/aromatic aminotransferase